MNNQPKLVTVMLATFDSDDFGGPIEQVINMLREHEEKFSNHLNIRIDVEYDCSWQGGITNIEYMLYGDRLETDAELAKRLKKEEKEGQKKKEAQQKIEERERKQYEKLKKKYSNE
jgi:hypothetical protein